MLEDLRSEIRRSVSFRCAEPEHLNATLRALARPGYALHPESPCRAGQLTLDTYRAVRGLVDSPALTGAAAVELQMEAAFMFDHVADQELDPADGLNAAEELALAIGVLSCGAAAASEAAGMTAHPSAGPRLLDRFHSQYVRASGGQFRDASAERDDDIGLEDAINITSRKSGSLGRFAAAFGAGLATPDQDAIDLLGEFGFNLFTYLQIVDDLRDACPLEGLHTDFEQNKKTVPLVYFYSYLSETRGRAWNDIMAATAGHNGYNQRSEVRRAYEACGAEVFCAILAETYLSRARQSLSNLENKLLAVDYLEQTLASVEFSPQELFALA